jgi:hypothetical protein
VLVAKMRNKRHVVNFGVESFGRLERPGRRKRIIFVRILWKSATTRTDVGD